jgi:hypothetical protein
MYMNRLHIILLLTIGTLLGSCDEDEPYVYRCEDGIVKYELFNDELNPQARLNKVGSSNVDYHIIQSDNELYQKLTVVFLRKKIDFKTKSLIVINFKTNPPVDVISQSVVADCNHNNLTVTAQLRYASIPVDAVNYVFAIVPKLPSGTSIKFISEYVK